jgi:hypothetical protein
MIDLPEPYGPSPSPKMANVSLPLYPDAAVYLKVVTLSWLSVPCDGFWETPDLCIAPGRRIGKLHVCPDLIAK